MSPSGVVDERAAPNARGAGSDFKRREFSIAPRHQCALLLCRSEAVISKRGQLCQLTTKRRHPATRL
jgi:hypothetical protein